MNKKLIYLGILALVLSHTVLERLIGLFVRNNSELAADISLVLFLVYILLVPILLVYLVGLWKIEFKKSILVYGLVIFLAVLVKSVWMFSIFSPEVTMGESLFNVVFQTAIPLVVFWWSYIIINKVLNKK